MNSNILPVNKSKYENLKEAPNAQYKHNLDDLQATPGVPNARPVFNNLIQSTEQKQKPNSNLASTSHTSFASTKNINSTTDKCQTYKLVDKQLSGAFQQADKKILLLDTYARIAASNNRRCPKRLRELAKPKRQARNDQNDYLANFDLNYRNATKTYGTETKRTLIEKKK